MTLSQLITPATTAALGAIMVALSAYYFLHLARGHDLAKDFHDLGYFSPLALLVGITGLALLAVGAYWLAAPVPQWWRGVTA